MDAKWIDFFTQLGLTTTGQILFLIVIGFFGKKLIEFFFSESIEFKKVVLNKELESFKQALSSQTQVHKLELDKNLESHKSLLQQISQENQIRFSKLHSDRAETIKILFSKIVIMEKSMNSLMTPFQAVSEPTLVEKSKVAANDANIFLDYFHTNEILFNEKTCNIINKLNDSFKTAWNKYTAMSPGQPNPANEMKRIEMSMQAYYDILNKEVIELKAQLKDDFRLTLGVK